MAAADAAPALAPMATPRTPAMTKGEDADTVPSASPEAGLVLLSAWASVWVWASGWGREW